MHIEDGTGGGYKAQVTPENKFRVYGVAESEQLHFNEDKGQMYSVLVDVVTTGAGGDDCFLYLHNNNDEDLVLTSFKVYVTSSADIYINLGDSGTPVGGTDVTPVNRNAGSGNSADCICQSGSSITGLNGGLEVDRIAFAGVPNQSIKYGWDSHIILPKNTVVTFYAEDTGGSDSPGIFVTMTLSMYFRAEI